MTGIAAPRTWRDGQAGMTLVEVLVVLSIIGVATAATVLSLQGADRASRSEAEARRLAQNINLAVDEAFVDGAPLALVWDAHGYRFVAWSPQAQAWGPSSTPILARHDLTPILSLERQGIEGAPAVMISSTAGSPATDFTVSGTLPAWHVRFDGFSASADVGDAR